MLHVDFWLLLLCISLLIYTGVNGRQNRFLFVFCGVPFVYLQRIYPLSEFSNLLRPAGSPLGFTLFLQLFFRVCEIFLVSTIIWLVYHKPPTPQNSLASTQGTSLTPSSRLSTSSFTTSTSGLPSGGE